MNKETQQPFHDGEPRSSADHELVGAVLGSAEEQAMRQMLDEQDGVDVGQPAPTEIQVTGQEAVAATEAEVDLSEKRRAEYLDWADEFEIDKDWILDSFTFLPDGLVIVEGNFDISNVKGDVTYLPEGLKEVKGNFSVSSQYLTSLNGSPERVGGHVSVSSCGRLDNYHGIPKDIGGDLVVSHINIPTTDGLEGVSVGGNLIALNFPIYKIPTGINLKGKIIIDGSIVKYKKDLEDKGYRVKVV